MKKCLNSSDAFVDESLEGIVRAYPSFYRFAKTDHRGIIFDGNQSRKVKIVTGGGYGHLPLFLGYVGNALCDGIAVGNVFTSPSSESIVEVARDLDSRQILFLFGNYFGDTMNFEMASELLEMDGIESGIVKGADDIASSKVPAERRGIAGILFAYKVAGAAADQGAELAEVMRVTRKAIDQTASLGVAFSSCELPGSRRPVFEMEADEMEIGMGIHGEPGIIRSKMMNSRELAKRLVLDCLADLKLERGARVAVLVNGLGSTSREELFVLFHDMADVFSDREIVVAKTYVGEYVTSMEMAGLSLSILKLDEELEALLQVPAGSPLVTL